MKRLQTEFMKKDMEVSEEKYMRMLNVLPPARMATNAFLVGEPIDHVDKDGKQIEDSSFGNDFFPRYEMYFTDGGKYYFGGRVTEDNFETFLIAS